MIAALAAITAAGIVLPHTLRLERVAPVTAIALWLSSLALRAIACLLAVVYALFFLPRTGLFVVMTHWCAHVEVPVSPWELAVEGHGLASFSLFVPGLVLAASLVATCIATVRDVRAARHVVVKHTVGLGPRDSVIVGGSDVLLAVAGFVRPRIIVSAGALTCLDDDELAAGLDHEQGHIARRHRFVMLVAVGLRALGRAVPGSGRAIGELEFHLERDADQWALRRPNDRVALASVICKAATAERPPAVVGIGTAGVRERLGQVLDTRSATTRRVSAMVNALATAMVALTLLAGALVPAAAATGSVAEAHRGHHRHHCLH
jgi:bla regulator protein blaR1